MDSDVLRFITALCRFCCSISGDIVELIVYQAMQIHLWLLLTFMNYHNYVIVLRSITSGGCNMKQYIYLYIYRLHTLICIRQIRVYFLFVLPDLYWFFFLKSQVYLADKMILAEQRGLWSRMLISLSWNIDLIWRRNFFHEFNFLLVSLQAIYHNTDHSVCSFSCPVMECMDSLHWLSVKVEEPSPYLFCHLSITFLKGSNFFYLF